MVVNGELAYAQIDDIFRETNTQRLGKILSDEIKNGQIWPLDKAPEDQAIEGNIYFDPVRKNLKKVTGEFFCNF